MPYRARPREQIGAIISASGASFVDGGIIGAPVQKAGTTRLYLSGSRASEVAALFSGSMLDARAIGSPLREQPRH